LGRVTSGDFRIFVTKMEEVGVNSSYQ